VITQPIKTPRLLRRRTNQKIPACSQQWALLLVAAQHQIAYWLQPQHQMAYYQPENISMQPVEGIFYWLLPQHQMAHYQPKNTCTLWASG